MRNQHKTKKQLIEELDALGTQVADLEAVVRQSKRVEEELRRSEVRLAEAQRVAHLGNWEWNIAVDDLWWSDEIYRIFGLSQQQFGATYEAFLASVHPEDRDRVRRGVNRALSEGELYSIDHRIVLPDGTERVVHEQAEVTFDETGRPQRMVGTVQDVTEWQEMEDRAQRYLDIAGVILVALDSEGQISLINRKGREVLGYETEEELIGQNWFDRCVPDEIREEVKSVFLGMMAGKNGPVDYYENPVQTKSGGQRLIAWHNTILRDATGTLVGTLSSGEDITERRVAEEAVRRSEADYRTLVEHATYGIYRSSVEGEFQAVNPALVEMLGYETKEELLAVRLARDVYRDPEVRAALIERDAFAERIEGVEVEWKRKDGSPITVRLSGRPAYDQQGKAERYEMIAEDVTERRRLEAQLRQAQKMEAVGELTGGIAHDFNNALTVIVVNAEFMAAALAKGQTVELDDVLAIRDTAKRASSIIRKLLSFSRRAELALEPIHLGEVVDDLKLILRTLLPETIDLQLETGNGSGAHVMADSGAIEQMLLNICTNSRDAMPHGGRIFIRVTTERLDEEFCRLHPGLNPGRWVRVECSDTGMGMDAQTLGRIFEPFFTTKPVESGTGLGMAMVYGLTKQQGGYVMVTSEPGEGTTTRLFFPACEDEAAGSVTEGWAELASL